MVLPPVSQGDLGPLAALGTQAMASIWNVQGRGARTPPVLDSLSLPMFSAPMPDGASPAPDEVTHLRQELADLRSLLAPPATQPHVPRSFPTTYKGTLGEPSSPKPSVLGTPPRPPLSPASVRVKANAAVDQLLGGRQDTVTLLNIVLEDFYVTIVERDGGGLATLLFLMLLPQKSLL